MLTNEELKKKYIKYSPEITEEIYNKILKRLKEEGFPRWTNSDDFNNFKRVGQLLITSDRDYFIPTSYDHRSGYAEISYKDIIGEEKLQLKDLVEGETYKFEWFNTTQYVWKYNTDKAINKVEFLDSFIKPKDIQFTNGILATPEEKQWLNVCIAKNKFIEKDIALKNYDMNGKALKSEFIPEYAECIEDNVHYPDTSVIGRTYKVTGEQGDTDWYIEYDGKKFPSVSKKRFKPSTKELYEAQLQQKEMKEVKEWWRDLKKGDYVVCVDDSYQGCCANKNYIYQNYENGGVWYGNSITSIGSVTSINYNSFRLATPEEIKLYEYAGKPVDITKYKSEVIEEEYKVGDWIVVINPCNTSTNKIGTIEQITAIQSVKLDGFGNCTGHKIGKNSWEHSSGIRKATPEEIVKITGKTEYFNDLSQHIGRYIKALVNSPNGGSVKKGEIGKILDSSYINFPSGENYAHSAALMESNKHKYELLPESYSPEVKADSKKFVLPEKWCVKSTDESDDILRKWRGGDYTSRPVWMCSDKCWISKIEYGKYTEITLDQFKKYVLKEEPIKTGKGILDSLEPKKDNMEDLLEEAKRRFPVGTKFNSPTHTGANYSINQIIEIAEFKWYDKDTITVKKTSKNNEGIVYSYGKWAEVISSLEESVKKDDLLTDKELLEYANKYYVVGTKFISSIVSSDNGKERECKYYDNKSSSFGWKVKNLESKGRVVHCDDGMYTKATNGSSVCSNPYIYSDEDGWCKITNSLEEKKTNHQFKVGDEVFLPEYGLGKWADSNTDEGTDYAEKAGIPLNERLVVERVDRGDIYLKEFLYVHPASKFKPISELNKKVKYNPVEWGWETTTPCNWYAVNIDIIDNEWKVPTLTNYPLLPEETFKQDVISPILFDVKKI